MTESEIGNNDKTEKERKDDQLEEVLFKDVFVPIGQLALSGPPAPSEIAAKAAIMASILLPNLLLGSDSEPKTQLKPANSPNSSNSSADRSPEELASRQNKSNSSETAAFQKLGSDNTAHAASSHSKKEAFNGEIQDPSNKHSLKISGDIVLDKNNKQIGQIDLKTGMYTEFGPPSSKSKIASAFEGQLLKGEIDGKFRVFNLGLDTVSGSLWLNDNGNSKKEFQVKLNAIIDKETNVQVGLIEAPEETVDGKLQGGKIHSFGNNKIETLDLSSEFLASFDLKHDVMFGAQESRIAGISLSTPGQEYVNLGAGLRKQEVKQRELGYKPHGHVQSEFLDKKTDVTHKQNLLRSSLIDQSLSKQKIETLIGICDEKSSNTEKPSEIQRKEGQLTLPDLSDSKRTSLVYGSLRIGNDSYTIKDGVIFERGSKSADPNELQKSVGRLLPEYGVELEHSPGKKQVIDLAKAGTVLMNFSFQGENEIHQLVGIPSGRLTSAAGYLKGGLVDVVELKAKATELKERAQAGDSEYFRNRSYHFGNAANYLGGDIESVMKDLQATMSSNLQKLNGESHFLFEKGFDRDSVRLSQIQSTIGYFALNIQNMGLTVADKQELNQIASDLQSKTEGAAKMAILTAATAGLGGSLAAIATAKNITMATRLSMVARHVGAVSLTGGGINSLTKMSDASNPFFEEGREQFARNVASGAIEGASISITGPSSFAYGKYGANIAKNMLTGAAQVAGYSVAGAVSQKQHDGKLKVTMKDELDAIVGAISAKESGLAGASQVGGQFLGITAQAALAPFCPAAAAFARRSIDNFSTAALQSMTSDMQRQASEGKPINFQTAWRKGVETAALSTLISSSADAGRQAMRSTRSSSLQLPVKKPAEKSAQETAKKAELVAGESTVQKQKIEDLFIGKYSNIQDANKSLEKAAAEPEIIDLTKRITSYPSVRNANKSLERVAAESKPKDLSEPTRKLSSLQDISKLLERLNAEPELKDSSRTIGKNPDTQRPKSLVERVGSEPKILDLSRTIEKTPAAQIKAPTIERLVENLSVSGQLISLKPGESGMIGRHHQQELNNIYSSHFNQNVSRDHATISRNADGAYFIEDKGSKLGTFVKKAGSSEWEALSSKHEMRPGDRFMLGGTGRENGFVGVREAHQLKGTELKLHSVESPSAAFTTSMRRVETNKPDLRKVDIDGDKFELAERNGWYYGKMSREKAGDVKVHIVTDGPKDLGHLQAALIPLLHKDPQLADLVKSWKTFDTDIGVGAPTNATKPDGLSQTGKAFTLYTSSADDAIVVQKRLDQFLASNGLGREFPIETGNVDSVRGSSNRVGIVRDTYEAVKFSEKVKSPFGNKEVGAKLDPALQDLIHADKGLSIDQRLNQEQLRRVEHKSGLRPNTLQYDGENRLYLRGQSNRNQIFESGEGPKVYLDESHARKEFGDLTDRPALYALARTHLPEGIDPADLAANQSSFNQDWLLRLNQRLQFRQFQEE